jgi:hypothetical protein
MTITSLNKIRTNLGESLVEKRHVQQVLKESDKHFSCCANIWIKRRFVTKIKQLKLTKYAVFDTIYHFQL